MVLSDYLELFAIYFKEKISIYDGIRGDSFKTYWYRLKHNIIQHINMTLEKEAPKNTICVYHESSCFNNNIFNHMDDYNTDPIFAKNQFKCIDSASINCKKFIESYLDIIHDDFVVDKNNNEVSFFFLYKLMILVCEKWEKIGYTKYYKCLDILNKMINIEYYGSGSLRDFIFKVTTCDKIRNRDGVMYDVITYLENVLHDIEKEDMITNKLRVKKNMLGAVEKKQIIIKKNTTKLVKNNTDKIVKQIIKKQNRSKKIPASVRNKV